MDKGQPAADFASSDKTINGNDESGDNPCAATMRYGRPGQPFQNGAFGRGSDSLLTTCRRLVPGIHLKEKGKYMKLKYPLAAIAAALVLAGCEHTGQVRRLTPEQQEAARAERQEAMGAYRALFAALMQTKLTDLDQRITEVGDIIVSLQDNPLADMQLDALRERRSELDLLVQDLINSSPESWGRAKQALESAFADLRLACQLVKITYDN